MVERFLLVVDGEALAWGCDRGYLERYLDRLLTTRPVKEAVIGLSAGHEPVVLRTYPDWTPLQTLKGGSRRLHVTKDGVVVQQGRIRSREDRYVRYSEILKVFFTPPAFGGLASGVLQLQLHPGTPQRTAKEAATDPYCVVFNGSRAEWEACAQLIRERAREARRRREHLQAPIE